MKVFKQNEYNQGIGKNKLLSSTAGIGSIIPTKLGYYILVSDINKWKFFQTINSKIESLRERYSDDGEVYKQALIETSYNGLEYIDDLRFVKFIKSEKKIDNLVCLIGIPHMSLNESYNTPNWKNHPINKILQKNNISGNSSDFMIMGTHFPKWFKNDKGILKPISKWRAEWNSKGMATSNFAPPRDVNAPIKNSRKEQVIKKYKDLDGVEHKIPLFKELTQTNLILICPNGHLTDIPWPNYIEWKHKKDKFELSKDDKGEFLFNNDKIGPCCSNKDRVIKWTENKNKSEGYSSIFIECLNCKKKVNLEGINSIQPFCTGEKPWELDLNEVYLQKEKRCVKTSSCKKCNHTHQQDHMQVALVTANNVYYANGFSSLFIPIHLAENKSKEILDALKIIEERYNKRNSSNPITKEDYWDIKIEDDFDEFLSDNGIIVTVDKENLKNQLKSEFLNIIFKTNQDNHEEYRWQEYRCFSQNSLINGLDDNIGLRFKDIKLPDELADFFKKILQVEDLKVTNVQLDFTRVKPKERIVVNGEVQESSSGQNIFSIDSKDLFTLPANETLGEGLFFEFSNDKIDNWVSDNISELENRFGKYLNTIPDSISQGLGSKMKIYNNKYKHFLIHSFSHMMMRELEFSCGYPTASLKERLYISKTDSDNFMAGVLIYTAEGSDGSMGGLVSQGEPEKILEIMKKGLKRSINCSSDPLCWESEGQGIFDLNLSACFSCSLVAETSCEEMNLGLDRRVLVDDEIGYFKNF
jgi:hypothetical protein